MRKLPKFVYVHEAGHAVAMVALGTRFDRVFVRTLEEAAKPYIDSRGRENHCIGMVEGGTRYNSLSAMSGGTIRPEQIQGVTPEILAAMRGNAEAEIMATLAGPIAEAKYRRCGLFGVYFFGGADDWKAVERVADDFTDDDTRGAFLDALERRTKALLRAPDVWAAVLATATALQQRLELSYQEVAEIKETGNREPAKAPGP